MKGEVRGLVGDVGGTNARFALVDGEGHIRFPKSYACEDYSSLAEIIEEYLGTTAGKRRPPRAAIAVAGPVVEGEIQFTNLDWGVSETDLVIAFEFEDVSLINDFAAQALAAPRLGVEDLRQIGPALKGDPDCPIVVLGAGTGFGVAGLARGTHGSEVAVATEGGHAGFAPHDETEVEVWRRLKAKYGRVSIERVLSGQGLFDLYGVLASLAHKNAELADERAVFAAGQSGDPVAGEALDRFCSILGGVAGDLALSYGARGGVYVSGGIAPRLLERVASGGFRTRFENKGRLTDYVSAIPTFVMVHPYAALVGAARELEQLERGGF
jgi:glucokinase